jgi:hypothetical protein
MDKWRFRRTGVTIEIDPPSGIDPTISYALWDFLTTEIGDSGQNLHIYRDLWEQVSGNPDDTPHGISGNGTRQRIEGDDVVLEAIYEQWETVRIPRAQFERLLDDFDEFLRSSGQRT